MAGYPPQFKRRRYKAGQRVRAQVSYPLNAGGIRDLKIATADRPRIYRVIKPAAGMPMILQTKMTIKRELRGHAQKIKNHSLTENQYLLNEKS